MEDNPSFVDTKYYPQEDRYVPKITLEGLRWRAYMGDSFSELYPLLIRPSILRNFATAQ